MYAVQAKNMIDAMQRELEGLKETHDIEMTGAIATHRESTARLEERFDELKREKEAAERRIEQLEKELLAGDGSAEMRNKISNLEATVTSAVFEKRQLKYALDGANDKVEASQEVIETMEQQLLHNEALLEMKDLKIQRQEARIATLERSRDILAREGALKQRMVDDLLKRIRELEEAEKMREEEDVSSECGEDGEEEEDVEVLRSFSALQRELATAIRNGTKEVNVQFKAEGWTDSEDPSSSPLSMGSSQQEGEDETDSNEENEANAVAMSPEDVERISRSP